MITDLNPKIYQISTDHFVYQNKQFKMTGKVNLPSADISVYNNGVLIGTTVANGAGAFTIYLQLADNENNIVVEYE